ncbi:MAG: hypothetical protein ABI823_11135 [Bryobacteraceae bacterium]
MSRATCGKQGIGWKRVTKEVEPLVVANQSDEELTPSILGSLLYREGMKSRTRSFLWSLLSAVLTAGLAVAQSDPGAGFSVQDTESTRANFGSRIAHRYLAVDVVIRNPTERKIQIDKSALWFEVDYETIPDPGEPPALLAFGVHHNFAQFAETFPAVLGTFDSIAGGRQKAFQLLELGVALAAGLSSGGVIRSAEARGAIALVTGLVLPRVQGIYWNPEVEKAKRTQLVTQSADRIVQIPPFSSVQTKVFLPRRGILGLSRTTVRIARVRRIHLDLEVVGETR